ncbi:deoxyribonuclease IV [candidate division KSB1 bacterium]|nr:deoxyribonuclease IV [candidate division KSB1 bacterium]
MKYFGAHVSIKGGVENAPIHANRIGAKAFALFTRNQRQWRSKHLTANNIERFKENCKIYGFSPEVILPHDSYLINLGHPERTALMRSRQAFLTEMKRCELLGLKFLNFHPGAHLNGMSVDHCLARIAESINEALLQTSSVIAVIENTAGQGTQLGYRFEHLAAMIDKIEDKTRVGVCLDTNHLFAAGYDLRDQESFHATFQAFEQIVGYNYLSGIHLNDSKKMLGSRVDRHANIGKGELGLEAFRLLMNDRHFNDMPLILETPHSDLYRQEIQLLYSLIEKGTAI